MININLYLYVCMYVCTYKSQVGFFKRKEGRSKKSLFFFLVGILFFLLFFLVRIFFLLFESVFSFFFFLKIFLLQIPTPVHSPVPLLSSHHDPHRAPLGEVDGLDHPGDLVDEGDGSGDVIQDRHVPENYGFS